MKLMLSRLGGMWFALCLANDNASKSFNAIESLDDEQPWIARLSAADIADYANGAHG